MSVICDRLVVSLGIPVSSTNKTDRHNIIEKLFKVALNTSTLTLSRPPIIRSTPMPLIMDIMYKSITSKKKPHLFYIIIYSGSSAMSIICESVAPWISSCSADKHSLSFVSLSCSSSSSLEFLQCNLFYVNFGSKEGEYIPWHVINNLFISLDHVRVLIIINTNININIDILLQGNITFFKSILTHKYFKYISDILFVNNRMFLTIKLWSLLCFTLSSIYIYNVHILSLSCNIKMSKPSAKVSGNSWKKRRNKHCLWRHLWHQHLNCYHFFLSLYMNQVPEILYLVHDWSLFDPLH